MSPHILKSRRKVALAKLSLIGVVTFFILSFIVIPLLAFNLPSPDEIVRREGFSTKILDRDGDVLYDIFEDERRTLVTLDEIPDNLENATIAIEDKNFYKHGGFDFFGTLRGLSRFITRGRAQGGSTITQQLVKNVLLTPERSVFRKIKELVLAIQIERKYEKDEILQMYLNEAPYGGTAWGVEAASETYFGKKAKELDLVESAILAGMPQRPSFYSPYSSNPEAYIERTENVLRRMREDEYISEEQERDALARLGSVIFQEKGASFKAPHFVQYVQEILVERYGEQVVEQGGLKVTTTLDLELQDEAQSIVKSEIDKVTGLKISNGAAVAVDPETGEILAMVGSRGFNDPEIDGQVNVTTSLRQPGSAIKPITYVTGFAKGFTASTLLMDVPTQFPGGATQPIYEPKNYDGEYRGPIQVRYALANSINVAAVKMLAMVGIRNVLETAYDLGLKSLEPTRDTLSRVGLSLTLGGGEVRLIELTGAYAAFVNGGFRIDPVAILKVEDSNGKVLEEVEPEKGKRVISEENAFLIANILSDNSARADVFGTNSLLNIAGRQIAVKTGTTNDQRDNWTVGGNTQIMIGVWVGNNDNSPMLQVASGVTGASPIWRRIVMAALAGKSELGFEAPKGIVTASVDKVSGYRSHDGYPSRAEVFAKGTEPGEDLVHKKLKVCKSDGKLAGPSDISSGNYDEKEYFVFREEDPTGGIDGENMWQKGIIEWLKTQSDPRYNPPDEYCGGGGGGAVIIEFVTPANEASDLPNKFILEVKTQSSSEVVQIELEVDGEKIETFYESSFSTELTLEDGTYDIRIKAKNKDGKESDRTIKIGVNAEWDS